MAEISDKDREEIRREFDQARGKGSQQQEGPQVFQTAPGSSIKHVIGVVSGKGGVGKSLVTGALAVELKRAGKKVAILDADITGPSIPKMFGMSGARATATDERLNPVLSVGGIEVMSINLVLEHETDPVLWRGPMLMGVLRQFFEECNWGDIDYLLVDMPPGTGDVALTVFQSMPLDGVVIVSSPQDLVQMVVSKKSGIKSVADMRGKNICVGAVGSGYEVAARQILGAYGMTYDDINETFADQATAKNGIQDGTFDAMFLCSGFPNGNVMELSLNKNIDVLSIDDEHMRILLDKYPYYARFETPSDDYNVGHAITSVAVKCMLIVNEKFSDQAIYELTKAIYEHLGEIQAINAKAKYMSIDSALNGIPANLHPGARKYYEEQGLAIPDFLK